MDLFLLILSTNNFVTTDMPNDRVSRLFVHLSETWLFFSSLFLSLSYWSLPYPCFLVLANHIKKKNNNNSHDKDYNLKP